MTLKSSDIKKLWANSGNICSFPECKVKLVPDKQANRVIGEEAHIKGEKPSAPRYDHNQTDLERDSSENRILLCPTHHTVVDSDPIIWTVEKLQIMKANHKQQVIRNWQHPEMMDELKQLVRRYEAPEQLADFTPTEIFESSKVFSIRVDASIEGGVTSTIRVRVGQRIALFARGLITYDGGRNFTTPEGIICNEYGIPLIFKDPNGNNGIAMWPHPKAYKTDDQEPGRIGSLIGWIDHYTEKDAFLIGSKREIEVTENGELFLLVNDAKGSYGDNDGEYRVDIRLYP